MAILRQGGRPDRWIRPGWYQVWTITSTGPSFWLAYVKDGDMLFIASTEWIVNM